MAVNEVLQGLGSWELRLKEETPDFIVSQLNYFGHVAIVDGPVDVEAAGNALLPAARYVGVCREQDHPGDYVRGGDGLIYWLGDEDGKGHTILSPITLTNATLTQVVTALKPPTVTTGTVYAQVDSSARYTGTHVFQSRREALAVALAPFGAEVRVNPDFSIDVGTPAQLYNTATPDTIIKRRGAGADVDLAAIGGDFDTSGSARDYSTDVTVVGQTTGTGGEPDTVFALATASAPSVTAKDPQGNPVKLHRLVSASTETASSAPATAALNLNRFNRTISSVKVTADDFEIQGSFAVGDATYVFDPDTGIVNSSLEVFFQGEKLNPDIVRVTGRSWPIVQGMTVAWRTDAGVWIDLTAWVVWETAGTHELTVGDLPKTLLSTSSPNAAVQDRVDAARGNPSTKVPKTPTGLTLGTSSAVNNAGVDSSLITASWSAVTQYADNTTAAIHHYEVQYRPQFRAPTWTATQPTDGLTVDLPAAATLVYDVQVRAVSTGGVASPWSATVSITAAADGSPLPVPADPVVTNAADLLKVTYTGVTSTGAAMPAKISRVDVEVSSTASSGPFTAEASLDPRAAQRYYLSGTYGSQRWVRLRAFDNYGNPSSPSAVVAGTIQQIADGDIGSLKVSKLISDTMTADVVVAGNVLTALTGQRAGLTSLGLRAWNASNVLTIDLNGSSNLITGRVLSALAPNRRIELGPSGTAGELLFYAPDGRFGRVRGFTAQYGAVGEEMIDIGFPITGTFGSWNTLQIQGDEQAYLTAAYINHTYGGGTGALSAFQAYKIAVATDRGTTTVQPSIITRYYLDEGSGHRWYLQGTSAAPALRMWLETSGTWQVRDDADIQRIGFTNSTFSPDPYTRFRQGPNATTGLLDILPGSQASSFMQTPRLKFYTGQINGTGGQYSAFWTYAINTDGTNAGFEARNANETFGGLKAAAFTVSSDQRGKAEIVDASVDGLDLVSRLTVREFRHRNRPQAEHVDHAFVRAPLDQHDGLGPVQLGVVAQELPKRLQKVGPDGWIGYEMSEMQAVHTKAIQQLADRLSDVERRIAA